MLIRTIRAWLGAGLVLGPLSVGLAAGAESPVIPVSGDGLISSQSEEGHEGELIRPTSSEGTLQYPAAIEASRHFAKIAHLVTPSLVHIQSHRVGRGGGTVEETGSGVIMQVAGHARVFVVTNQHVINGAQLEDIEIKYSDGRIERPVSKLEDLETDVAVLIVREQGLRPANWGDSDALDIGHMVLAMGSPFGLSKSITFGIISAKGRRSLNLGSDRDVLNQDFLQTDAAINPGNSGGPLIDMYGRVVGINTAIASSSGGNEGIGFSIPSNLVQSVVKQLLSHGHVQRAYLGVVLDEHFDVHAARKYSPDITHGARVVKVLEDTPAAAAGLRPDDIILSFDGRDIEDENHLIHLVSLTELNRTVRLVVFRDGRRETISVRLTDRSNLNTQSELPRELRPEGRDVTTETVGLSVEELATPLIPQIGLTEATQGLVVMSLPGHLPRTDSPERAADPAGSLQLYDVIVEVARTPVTTVEDFSARLDALTNESAVLLKIRRVEQGETQTRLILWQRPLASAPR
jgi:serine protease Do